MTFRHLFSWKSVYYEAILPALRVLGPKRADALLGMLGRLIASVSPKRRRELRESLYRARLALGGVWDHDQTLAELEANIPRFLGRDCLWDGKSPKAYDACFEVDGAENVEAAKAMGRGMIVVGCHLGSHFSIPHWFYRNRERFPMRMLVQRPQHASKFFLSQFEIPGQEHPQTGFFVNRQLSPEEASRRIFRTRAALRDGLAIYLMGDVPWEGTNTRTGSLLGFEQSFQSLWVDFAVLFKAPVVIAFSIYLPDGRTRVTFKPPMMIRKGEEDQAVRDYLRALDSEIAAHPANAVAHLLWPCYGPNPTSRKRKSRHRPASATAPLANSSRLSA